MYYGRDFARNPYGARGGYVDSNMYDMARRGRGRYDMDEMDYNMYDSRRGGGRDYGEYDYERGDFSPYNMDRHKKSMLDDRTLEMWSREMMQEIEPMHHQKFKMDAVVKKAEEMGIRFDKYTPMEYYATVVMLVSDFGKTLGMSNIDIYTKLAKDWLCDPDAGIKYGEKLAAYYYNIANV
jgi:hypothetical protein